MVNKSRRTIFTAVLALLVLAVVLIPKARASQLTSRKVTLGSSAISTSTTHKYDFNIISTSTLGSIKFLYCTTASGTCTTPAGLTTTSATLTAQSGNTGFSMVNTTNGSPYITRTAAAGSAVASSYTLGAITNPSTTNTTFFIRVSTYASIDTTGGVTDDGVVAASTANQITVSATVDETLTFCVYTGANCGAGGSTVALGTLTTSSTGTGISKMDAGTNASGGYNITYSGTTLTSGSNTITAMNPAATSATNTSQFGINLKDNVTPNIGAEITPASNGTNLRGQSLAGYSTIDTFKFLTGDSIANSGNASLGPSDSQTYTISYIANISASQAAGAYSTTLTYICTATF